MPIATLALAGPLLYVSSFAGWFPVFPSPNFVVSWFCFLSGIYFVLCVFTLRSRVGMVSAIQPFLVFILTIRDVSGI